MEDKKTPAQWSEIYGVKVRDPDGWRMLNAPSWTEPIDRAEWQYRMAFSTISVEDLDKYRKHWLDKTSRG